mgnify:CR=1 FL=1
MDNMDIAVSYTRATLLTIIPTYKAVVSEGLHEKNVYLSSGVHEQILQFQSPG